MGVGEFLATLIAAWRRGKAVILMEDHRHVVREIEGGAPEGTSLIRTGSEACAINVAGRKVSPAKVERVLSAVPGVEKVRVEKSLSPDFERFEEISVTVTTSLEKKELRSALRESLESWEMPRHWQLIGSD